MNETILEMKGINKNFPGVKALDNVSINLKKGEVLSLIGENGAGKSTLMKILLGIYSKDSGEIVFDGEKVNFKTVKEALDAGISMIHQELNLVAGLNVSENIWLGREEIFTRVGIVNEKQSDAATKKLFEDLGITMDIHAKVKDLSVAEMQLTELARAISYNSKVIIMDEPTSALSKQEIELLYRIIRDLTAKGTSIVFISHKIDEIFTISDRISILRDGKNVKTCRVNDITGDELIALIAGREIDQIFPKERSEIKDVILKVENISGEGFHNVSFELYKGEILGFCGLMGAGRTEIMDAIFGITKIKSGKVFIEGKEAKIKQPQDAIDIGIGMITEDRLRQGVIHVRSVKDNMTYAVLDRECSKFGFINKRKEISDCNKEINELMIRLADLNIKIRNLSGGNQQKVIIGRWLLTNPKILIMDEPTRGIDVGAKAEIYKLINNLAQKGMSILLVSSELPEVMGMSDRILVVKDGEIRGEFLQEEATQENLMKVAFGV